VVATALGALGLVAFPFVERRARNPLVPLAIFRSRQFSGANATTLAVYAALGAATFLLVLELETALGYSAVEAGLSLLPITLLMLGLSPRAGRLAQRIGPRLPMTVGPMIVAAGLVLLSRIAIGSHYVTGVLPGVVVLGLGLAITVAPLTAAVLGAVDDHHVGAGSGINHAVARVASLLAVAVLPLLAGLDTAGHARGFAAGVGRALLISAGLAVAGGVVAAATIRRAAPVETPRQQALDYSCHDPCVRKEQAAA
jgi:hypothetical protein